MNGASFLFWVTLDFADNNLWIIIFFFLMIMHSSLQFFFHFWIQFRFSSSPSKSVWKYLKFVHHVRIIYWYFRWKLCLSVLRIHTIVILISISARQLWEFISVELMWNICYCISVSLRSAKITGYKKCQWTDIWFSPSQMNLYLMTVDQFLFCVNCYLSKIYWKKCFSVGNINQVYTESFC